MFKMVAFKLDFFFQMTQKMPENLVCSSWWRFFLLFVASRGGKNASFCKTSRDDEIAVLSTLR